MANFGPLSRGQPHSPDVNHCILHFHPEGHREPHNKVGLLSLAKQLVGFELGTFQFLQCLNSLSHSPQLLNISPKNYIFSKTFNSEFSYSEVWFTDQNSKPIEIEDKMKCKPNLLC